MMNLAFIGGGNMAQALIAGLYNQQVDMARITVVDPGADKRAHLAQQFGVNTTALLADIQSCDVIVLAVKPQQLPALARELAPLLAAQLIISIAAGVRLGDLSRWLSGYTMIVRAMPNTPAQIQAGITGLYALQAVSEAQISLADFILSAAGSTLWLDSEDKLDALTAISGSGPAYVFYLMEGLCEAASALGFSEAQAKQLAIATFKGASLLADASTTPVATLRAQVTSKGGTTEQGILSLEKAKVKPAIQQAAQCAYARAKTLGEELGQL